MTGQEPIDTPMELEIEYEEYTTHREFTGKVILWVDGTGLDISNAPVLDDRHGRTATNLYPVKATARRVEEWRPEPQLFEEGHD